MKSAAVDKTIVILNNAINNLNLAKAENNSEAFTVHVQNVCSALANAGMTITETLMPNGLFRMAIRQGFINAHKYTQQSVAAALKCAEDTRRMHDAMRTEDFDDPVQHWFSNDF